LNGIEAPFQPPPYRVFRGGNQVDNFPEEIFSYKCVLETNLVNKNGFPTSVVSEGRVHSPPFPFSPDTTATGGGRALTSVEDRLSIVKKGVRSLDPPVVLNWWKIPIFVIIGFGEETNTTTGSEGSEPPVLKGILDKYRQQAITGFDQTPPSGDRGGGGLPTPPSPLLVGILPTPLLPQWRTIFFRAFFVKVY